MVACGYGVNQTQYDSIIIILIEFVFIVATSIGLWTFSDQAINLRYPSAIITTFNTPFVPAFSDGITNVISFLGHRDSYVWLENKGHLAVSSFTWSAMIFPQRTAQGTLINWWCNWPDCQNSSIYVKINKDQKLKFGVCSGSAMSWMTNTTTVMAINQWHVVAISYDDETGSEQTYVDGVLHSGNIGRLAQGLTTGPVVLGSRNNHSDPSSSDDTFFHRKMACMRLWNTARDPTLMRMNTPFCNINWS